MHRLIFLSLMLFSSEGFSECAKFIELLSAKEVAKEMGQTEMWVLGNWKINLWDAGRTKAVGKLLPGSRAIILDESKGEYLVRSPYDKSEGWVSKIQVKKTLFQDDQTFKSCKPKK